MDATPPKSVESFARCLCIQYLSGTAEKPLLNLLNMSPPPPADLASVNNAERVRFNRALESVWNSGEELEESPNATSSDFSSSVATGTSASLLSMSELCAIDYSKFLRWKLPMDKLFFRLKDKANGETPRPDDLGELLHLIDHLEDIANKHIPSPWKGAIFAAAGLIMYNLVASCSCREKRCTQCCVVLFRLAYHYYNDCGTGSIATNRHIIVTYLSLAKHHRYAQYAIGVLMASQWRLLEFDEILSLSTTVQYLKKADIPPARYLVALLKLQGWSIYKAYKPPSSKSSPALIVPRMNATPVIKDSSCIDEILALLAPREGELADPFIDPRSYHASLKQLSQCRYVREVECEAHLVLPMLRIMIFQHRMRDFAIHSGTLLCSAIKKHSGVEIPAHCFQHIGCGLSESFKCCQAKCCCLHQLLCASQNGFTRRNEYVASLIKMLPSTKTTTDADISNLCKNLSDAAQEYLYKSDPLANVMKICKFGCDASVLENIWKHACNDATDVLKAPVVSLMDPCTPLSVFMSLYAFAYDIMKDAYRKERLIVSYLRGLRNDQGSQHDISDFRRVFGFTMRAYLTGTEHVKDRSASEIAAVGLQQLSDKFSLEEASIIYHCVDKKKSPEIEVSKSLHLKLPSCWREINSELLKQLFPQIKELSNATISQRLLKTQDQRINTTWSGVKSLTKTLVDLAKEFRSHVRAVQSFMMCDATKTVLDYAAISYNDPWINYLLPLSEYYSTMLQGCGYEIRDNASWYPLYREIVECLDKHHYPNQLHAKVRFALCHYPHADSNTSVGAAMLRHQLQPFMHDPSMLVAACDAMILDHLLMLHCELPKRPKPRASNNRSLVTLIRSPSPKAIAPPPATPRDESSRCDEENDGGSENDSFAPKCDGAPSLFKLPHATVRVIFAMAQFFLHLKLSHICNQQCYTPLTSLVLQSIFYHPLSLPAPLPTSLPSVVSYRLCDKIAGISSEPCSKVASCDKAITVKLSEVASQMTREYISTKNASSRRAINGCLPLQIHDIVELLKSVRRT